MTLKNIINIKEDKNIWLLVTISLIIKLIVLYLIPNKSFPDSLTYMNAGIELFDLGQIKVDNVMPLHPIYTYILGNALIIKLVDIILSSLTVFFVYKLSIKIFKNKYVAVISSIITGLYPFFIFYSITGLSETLYIFLLTISFYSLYSKRFVLGSFFIVLSILQRPLLDILAIPLVICFSILVHKQSYKKTFFNVCVYTFIYLVLMTPWWHHQYSKYDSFVRLNLGTGTVLYAGNNPLNSSGGGVTKSEKGADVNFSKFNSIEDPIEKNNAKINEAINYILDDKIHFIKMSGVKFMRFWRLWPYAPEYEKGFYIIASVLSYGIILLLFIIYLFKNLKKDFYLVSPILLIIIFLTIVHMVTISSIRYRLPLEPFLIILASKVLFNLLDVKFKLTEKQILNQTKL